MLLEHAALQEDHGLVTIEGADLARVEIPDVNHLRRGDAGSEQERENGGESSLHEVDPPVGRLLGRRLPGA